MNHIESPATEGFSDRLWAAVEDASTHFGLASDTIGGILLTTSVVVTRTASGDVATADLLREISDKVMAEARDA